MQKNWGKGDGGSAHQTPIRTPTVCVQTGIISGLTTRFRPGVHQRRHGDEGGGTTIRRGRAGGGGLYEPPELAPAIRSDERGVADNGCGLHRVASEWETPLGSLLCADFWTVDCTE